MSASPENPYSALERIFHEPNRLAIMSALAGAPDGLSFNDLKQACRLTDGNLSRHLKALGDWGAVKIDKAFDKNRPKTTIHLSAKGRQAFLEYLRALEEVLQKAAAAIVPEKKGKALFPALARLARA